MDFLTSPEIPGPLRDKYRMENKHSWPRDSYTQRAAPGWSDPRLGYLLVDKIPESLAIDLQREGFAEMGRGRDSRWLGISSRST